jgi:hypothetical protein
MAASRIAEARAHLKSKGRRVAGAVHLGIPQTRIRNSWLSARRTRISLCGCSGGHGTG